MNETATSHRQDSRWAWIALATIMALSVALRLAFIDEPFERDEGFYSAIGLQILDGGVPYRDGVDQKGPLVFYLYAFGMAVFGQTMEAVRVFTAGYNLLTLLGVFMLARSLGGTAPALLAAFLYAVASSLPHLQAASSNAEVFLVAPLVWSAVFALRWLSSGGLRWLALAGLANVAALLIKVVAAPFSLVLLAMVIWQGWRSERLRSALGAFLIPQALCVATVAGYFAAEGALRDMIHFTILMPLAYVRADGLTVIGPSLGGMLAYLRDELLPFSVFALLLPLVRPWFRRTPADLYFAALPLAAIAATLLPGKNFPHYFINLLPFFAAATAVAVVELLRQRRWPIRALAAIPLLLLVRLGAAEHTLYWQASGDEVSQAKYGPEFVVARDIGRYLAERTRPGDHVFQWGFEPQLYLISGRRIPGRFIASTVLVAMPDPLQARQELANDLVDAQPVYIVVFDEWGRYPGLEVVSDFIRWRGYRVETRFPTAYVFRRPD